MFDDAVGGEDSIVLVFIGHFDKFSLSDSAASKLFPSPLNDRGQPAFCPITNLECSVLKPAQYIQSANCFCQRL